MARALTLSGFALRVSPAPLLLLCAALLLFTVGLGNVSLWDQDEARYTEAARQMVERGDPMTLYFNGEPWFDKPPLVMWLVAATGGLVGFTEFTARIWAALFGAAGVVVTFLLGRRLYDGRTGTLAGLMLMTMLEYFAISRLAILDAVLLTFMLLVLYMVLVGMKASSGAEQRRAYRWAFVWAGLATLTKGPMGLLLPAMVIGSWWALLGIGRRRVRELPWDGIMLFAVIGLSWYLVETLRHGLPFLRAVVGQHLVARFFGVVDNQPGPWYYYVPVLAAGGFPWIAFVPSAAVFHARRLRSDGQSLLLLLWMGLTVLFFSAAGTKLPNYILPVYPIAAIAVARLWVVFLGEGTSGEAAPLIRWGFWLLLVTTAAPIAAVVIFGQVKYPQEFALLRQPLGWFGLLLAGGVLLATGLFARRSLARALIVLLVTMAVTFAVLVLAILPRVERLRPIKPMALMIRSQMQLGDRIIGVGVDDRPSLSYYSHQRVISVWNREEARRALCGSGGAFVVARRAEYERWVRSAFAGQLSVLSEQADLVLARKTGAIPCGPT